MRIGRFTGSTLSGWKGRNSCNIEVRGSAVRCPYLSDPALFDTEGPSIEPSEIMDYISSHRSTLEAVCVSGGEPLAQEGIYPFLKELRKLKLPIQVSTEGTCPDTLDDLVGAGYINRAIALIPADLRTCGHRAELLRSLEVLNSSDIEYEAVTVLLPGVSDESTMEDIACHIRGKGILILRSFDPAKYNDPALSGLKPMKKKDAAALRDAARSFCRKVELR